MDHLIGLTPEHGNTPYFYIFDLKILNHNLRCGLLTMAEGQWNAGELHPWLRPGTANSHLRMGGMEYSSIRSDLHPLQKKKIRPKTIKTGLTYSNSIVCNDSNTENARKAA